MATQILESAQNFCPKMEGVESFLPPGFDLDFPYTWSPTSEDLLAAAEARVFSKRLKSPYKTRGVDIGKNCRIWTLSINEDIESESSSEEKVPLVLLHGLGASIGFWTLNLDALAVDKRPVYAIDHLGFGRSSRPDFSSDPAEAEDQFVWAIEEWRKAIGLKKFVLLGHSLGGYLATSYALKHPQRIEHLILADPWGFPNHPKKEFSWWFKGMIMVAKPANCFGVFRKFGPAGPMMMQVILYGLIKKFCVTDESGKDDSAEFGEYFYHCNAQTPSGETAFMNTMMEGFVWAKRPMVQRIPQLDPKLPVTTILGSTSKIRWITAKTWQENRPPGAYSKVHMLEGIGHDVHVEAKDQFHQIVLGVCSQLDQNFVQSQD